MKNETQKPTFFEADKNNHDNIENYMEFLKNVQGSTNTKTNVLYKMIVVTYNKSLNKPFKKATRTDVLKYLGRYSTKARDDRLTRIKAFYRWVYDLEINERLPDCVRGIKKIKKGLKKMYDDVEYRQRIVTPEELNKLIETARLPVQKALIETLYNFGTRVSELVSIKGDGVSFDGTVTKITVTDSKTFTRDVIYRGRSEHLLKYYESYSPNKDKKDKALFVTDNYGTEYKATSVSIYLRQHSDKNLRRRITPHDCRHSRVTLARKEGMPQSLIEQNYGYTKGSAMMQIYDHSKSKDVEDYLKKDAKETKPTYELLQKQKETLEKQHAREISELKKRLDDVVAMIPELIGVK